MKLIRDLKELPALDRSVVTIGNFDGVHMGHRAILETLRGHGQRLGVPTVVMTFEPHPLARIAPERAPIPISTPAQRVRLLSEAGIDVVVLQEFTHEFSRLSPEEFIEQILVGVLHAAVLSVGQNFRFGHEHRGSIETLRMPGRSFEVVQVAPVVFRGDLVSSSRIRASLHDGRVGLARRMLGGCYEIEGILGPGEGRGGRETVPTLNMVPENPLMPRTGVYLTRVALGEGEEWADAVTNVGRRPTFGGGPLTVETFVPDRTIRQREGAIRLRFISRLRDERRFPNPEALREQILRDVERCRTFSRRRSREQVGGRC